MKLEYNKKEISATMTTNPNLLKYHFQKLYYAIIIKNCNRYSSIANKQRIDVVFTNDDLEILSIQKEMHENTVFQNENAHLAILLPLNFFPDLKIGTKFSIIESHKSFQNEKDNT